jgi:hypothetical protein
MCDGRFAAHAAVQVVQLCEERLEMIRDGCRLKW